MSTFVEDEDPDEVFRQIMEGVVLNEPTDVIAYHELDDVQLAQEYDKVRRRLHEMDELYNLNPTGEAADLHSQFSAINVELRRRNPQSQ